MTGRERILLAFAHQEPDRVPFFEQGIASRVASDVLGRAAMTGGGAFRFRGALAAYDGPQAWAEFQARYLEDYAALVEALDFDMVSLPWVGGGRPSRRLDEHTLRFDDPATDTWHILRFDAASDTFQEVDSAFRSVGLPAVRRYVEALARLHAGDHRDNGSSAPVGPALQFLLQRFGRASTKGRPRAVAAGVTIAVPMHEPWLEALLLRPGLIEVYLDIQLETNLVRIDRLAGLGVDVIWGGGDLATNKGPIYSPASLRRFLLPRLRKMTERCHQHGLPYVFRSDGWLWPIVRELFVESGVDGYGEIDAQAGMQIPELKERLPQLTLWGGVDCAGALVTGTPAQVAEETRRALEAGAPGGGYILGSSNVIHSEVRAENFLEMMRTLQQYG